MLEQVLGFATLVVTLFIPGYFITLAFFPKKSELDAIERITLSFVFSITLLPLLTLLENILLAIPINSFSVWANFAIITAVGLFSYLARTGKTPRPFKICDKIFPPVSPEEAVPIIPLFGKK